MARRALDGFSDESSPAPRRMMTLSEARGATAWVPANAEQVARRRRMYVAVPAAAVLAFGVVASLVALPNQADDVTQAMPAPHATVATPDPTPTPSQTPSEEPAQRPEPKDASRDQERPEMPAEPFAIGGFKEHEPVKADSQYATEKLNVREEPTTEADKVASLDRGDSVDVTEKSEEGWQEVIIEGDAAWVSAEYLSDSKPSTPTPTPSETESDSDEGGLSGTDEESESGESETPDTSSAGSSGYGSSSDSDSDDSSDSSADESDSDDSDSGSSNGSANCESLPGLTANAQSILDAVCSEYGGSIDDYGGNRSESGSNHNSGRAVDFMISDVSTGQQIANWVRANGAEHGVTEVIFNQKIWTTQRSSEGWRSMEDRGSPTANHVDHVHVSVS